MEAIISTIPKEILDQDVKALGTDEFLVSRGDFDVYWARAYKIPNILLEIGRLREETFRSVGEGTGKAVDIDEFDDYYYNMFIWDRIKKQVVGGYRMGLGEEILNAGVSKFYINSLFNIDEQVHPILKQSIELGRSYIVKEYQKGYLPFFLLWRGILSVLERLPNYRYLIGPVSISKYYSDTSKGAIITFVKKYFYDEKMAQYFEPKTPFNYEIQNAEFNNFIEKAESTELKDLEGFLNSIEPKHIKVPVLLKQYTKLNAKFISFNLDPNFSDALDGLMVLDIKNLPAHTLQLLNDK